jgi:hypothetical protein
MSVSGPPWAHVPERRPITRPRQSRTCLRSCEVQAWTGARAAERCGSEIEVRGQTVAFYARQTVSDATTGNQIRLRMPRQEAALRSILRACHLILERSASRHLTLARNGQQSQKATDAGRRHLLMWKLPTRTTTAISLMQPCRNVLGSQRLRDCSIQMQRL